MKASLFIRLILLGAAMATLSACGSDLGTTLENIASVLNVKYGGSSDSSSTSSGGSSATRINNTVSTTSPSAKTEKCQSETNAATPCPSPQPK